MVRKKDIIFSWNNVVSDIDQISLREFLRDDLNIACPKDAIITKVDNKTIKIEKADKFSAQIVLDQKAILKLSNGKSYDLIAQEDNGNLNIYKTEIEGIGKSTVGLPGIILIAVYHILLSLFLLAGLVTFLSATAEGSELEVFNFVFTTEANLVIVVALSGALGGLVYSLRSFYKYVGNRKLIWSWFAMYILLPFVGTCMGLVFYLVVRAGFFSPEANVDMTSPFGFAALAALVGLFSEQAILKLKDVSETVFTKGEVRKDDIASRPESDGPVNGEKKETTKTLK
jgi:hypothetical protein